ncbi:hypothetical protein BDV19DRAFT_391907 [Aspergillus venezuelensis]
MLLGTPEIALNQLPDILNIHAQPNVVPCEEKWESSFHRRLTTVVENGLPQKPVETWTQRDVSTLQNESMRDLEAIEESAATASCEGKILFAQVDPSNILNPAAISPPSLGKFGEMTTDDMKAMWKRFDLDGSEGYEPRDGDFLLTPPNSALDRRNQTILPGSYLGIWKMVFFISDPVVELPLAYSDITLNIRHSWIPADMVNPLMKLTSALHEWCAIAVEAGLTPEPVIIDLDDLHDHDRTGLAPKVCEILGLDPGLIRFELLEIAQEDHEEGIDLQRPGLRRFLAQGVNVFDARVANRRELWEDEFGEEAAGVLERCVRDAMPGYEAMYARRLH